MRCQKTFIALMRLAVMVLLMTGCTPPGTADLVIQSFRILEYEWSPFGTFGASVEVTVKNVGNAPASTFEVAIVGVNREEKYVRFDFSYDPALTRELASGQQVTLTGQTGLGWHGHFDVTCADENYDPTLCAMRDQNTLWLMAIADYCAGDGVSDTCAVNESDETNNTSDVIVIEKP